MSDKVYRENDYNNYPRSHCAQQIQTNQRGDNFLPYSFNSISVPMSNNVYNQTQGQPMYNIMYGPQSMYRNHNGTTTMNPSLTQQMDSASWISDPCLSTVSASDKDKSVKQSIAQLSPAVSCCSSVDPLACSPMSDFYKTMNKDFYNKAMLDSQWFHGTNYNGQKYNEYPSCAQLVSANNDDVVDDRNVKYCNVQKYQENDKVYTYTTKNSMSYPQTSKIYSSCQIPPQFDCSAYDTYEEKQTLNETNSCYVLSDYDTFYSDQHVGDNEPLPFESITNMDVKTNDGSNGGGESDIIVEESEEELDNDSDDDDDDDNNEKIETRCIVCNVLNAPTGAQFYVLTSDAPLSMSSQRPVYEKLIDIVGQIVGKKTSQHLCSHCLALINTIDHLENNLENTKRELLKNFKRNSNKSSGAKIGLNANRNVKRIKFRHFCGLHGFKCRICKKKFSLKALHNAHMAKHRFKYNFLCELCGKRFVRRKGLTSHLKQHDRAKKRCKTISKYIEAFICDLCTKPFRTKSNLKEHRFACNNSRPHECHKCNKKFVTITRLNNHVKLKHDNVFKFTCATCGKGFVKESDYKTHLMSHSTAKNYKCTRCGKCYKTANNLNHHLKYHDKRLPFVCAVCDKGFIRKEYLDAHVNTHNGLKPYACNKCGKSFVSQKNLDSHLKTHSVTTKKKTCNVCGKELIRGLMEHIRTHSNDKLFECNACGTKFNTKGALYVHNKRKHVRIVNK